MNVYTCTTFRGHWPVATAAAVVANNAEDAAHLLMGALAAALPQRIEACEMVRVDIKRANVVILRDGDY